MDSAFDPTIAGFTPRDAAPRHSSTASNPWSSDYRMGDGASSNARFLDRSGLNSPGPGGYRAPGPDSYAAQPESFKGFSSTTYATPGLSTPALSTPNASSGGVHSGSFNGLLTPNLTSVGLSSMRGVTPRAPASFNSTVSPNVMRTVTPSTARLSSGLGLSAGGLRAGVNSPFTSAAAPGLATPGSAAPGSAAPGSALPGLAAAPSAASKRGWQHSAFSPGTSGYSDAGPRPRQRLAETPRAASPLPGPKPAAPPSAAGSDTFIMETDDSPAEIISELKLQVESLITAIVMSKSQSSGVAASSALQGADGVEVAHRIMNRLKALRSENEYLGKLTSGTRTAELEAKIQALEDENTMLKEQLHELQESIEQPNN